MKSNKPYPTRKVIFAYALIAPWIGCLLVFVSSFIIAIIHSQNINDYEFIILTIFFVIAAFMAIIPAFITGIWVANTKTYICNKKDYLKIFNKGVISCFILFFIISFIIIDLINGLPIQYLPSRIYDNFSKEYYVLIIFSLIGGLSSVITAKLFLPKPPKDFEK